VYTDYQAAVDHSLMPKAAGAPIPNVTLSNKIPIVMFYYLVTSAGDHAGWNDTTKKFEVGYPAIAIGGNASRVLAGVLSLGDVLLLTSASTGAFVGLLSVTQGQVDGAALEITGKIFSAPNDIGRTPVPTATTIIPPDSTHVMVGYGTLPNSNLLIREQYWRRMPESCSVAPGQTKELSYTTTTGMESVTSTQEEVAASVGASVSGGWGPISASVSMNLSKNSTTFQQVTCMQETVVYTSDKIENKASTPSMYLFWQLMDLITVTKADNLPIASILSGGQPAVIGGPYAQAAAGSA
jgi:hypothetical protein